jgi:protease PrsW
MTMAYSILVVGFSEEFSKFIVLRFYIFQKKDFNEPFDGIVYSVVISMGFAMVENILYVVQGGLNVALIRMFTAVPAHAAFGVLMGYFAGKAKFSQAKGFYLALGLIVAMFVHGAYDFFIFQVNYPSLKIATFVVLIGCIMISLKAIRNSSKLSPYKFRKVSES